MSCCWLAISILPGDSQPLEPPNGSSSCDSRSPMSAMVLPALLVATPPGDSPCARRFSSERLSSRPPLDTPHSLQVSSDEAPGTDSGESSPIGRPSPTKFVQGSPDSVRCRERRVGRSFASECAFGARILTKLDMALAPRWYCTGIARVRWYSTFTTLVPVHHQCSTTAAPV